MTRVGERTEKDDSNNASDKDEQVAIAVIGFFVALYIVLHMIFQQYPSRSC
jgi:hypothetical protein